MPVVAIELMAVEQKQRLGALGPAKVHSIEQKKHLLPDLRTVLDSAEWAG
jgi:hypothetical protein